MRNSTAYVDTVRRIAEGIAEPHAVEVDRDARFPSETITALREANLLGAFVPRELGGLSCGMLELAGMCDVLGQHCASSAMIFAMHQIQVACIVRHGLAEAYFQRYLRELAASQLLIASVTSEVGVGGEMRTSQCAVVERAGRFELQKDATTVSYGAEADDLLITARRHPDAAPSDQTLVLGRKAENRVERTGSWDTLGMRGTCSPAYRVTTSGSSEQILPQPFADISSHSMVPFSHVLWANCWLGIATAAAARARGYARARARNQPGQSHPSALRLSELASLLQTMRAHVSEVATECDQLVARDDSAAAASTAALSSVGFALKMNNLKLSASELVVTIVSQSLRICGIAGYANDTKFSIGRHLRDAHSAALMVSNDRIHAINGSLLLVLKNH